MKTTEKNVWTGDRHADAHRVTYEVPSVELMDVQVEKGYAGSIEDLSDEELP
jgi:hypothetical protein